MRWFKKLFGRKEATPVPGPTVTFEGPSFADLAVDMTPYHDAAMPYREIHVSWHNPPYKPMTTQIYEEGLGTFIVLVKDEVKAHVLIMEIERLKRNKKKHSHLLAQLKALEITND